MIHTVGLAYTKNDAHSLCGLGARALTSVTGATKKKNNFKQVSLGSFINVNQNKQ